MKEKRIIKTLAILLFISCILHMCWSLYYLITGVPSFGIVVVSATFVLMGYSAYAIYTIVIKNKEDKENK